MFQIKRFDLDTSIELLAGEEKEYCREILKLLMNKGSPYPRPFKQNQSLLNFDFAYLPLYLMDLTKLNYF